MLDVGVVAICCGFEYMDHGVHILIWSEQARGEGRGFYSLYIYCALNDVVAAAWTSRKARKEGGGFKMGRDARGEGGEEAC
jgi:hypothetical protein